MKKEATVGMAKTAVSDYFETQKTRYIPVTQWNNYHDWPTTNGLRHFIFLADSNGFNKVIRRVGRRILIDEQAFFQWVEEQNANTKPQTKKALG